MLAEITGDPESYVAGPELIRKAIATLLGSFPNAAPGDPKVYTAMLLEEVNAADPSYEVLESACRKIRRTSKFVPAVAEVLGGHQGMR